VDGIRVDSGYASGDEVTPHYDAMLAKVVAWAETRETAVRRLAGALRRARIHGVTTNREQLLAILTDEDFLAGRVSTGFLDELEMPRPGHDDGAPVAAALGLAEHRAADRQVQRGVPVAWRNVPALPQRTEFAEASVEWWGGRGGYAVDGCTVIAAAADRVTLERDGVRTTYTVTHHGSRIDVDSPLGHRAFTLVPRFVDPSAQHASGSLLAPMPGTVVSVAAVVGDRVEAGQPVLVIEAMKMQHTVSAPEAGMITELDVAPGRQVAAGEVVAVVHTEAEGEQS
jgi:propionyl-CoA carboxylase alpha chain